MNDKTNAYASAVNMMNFLCYKDVLNGGHCVPAFVIFIASVVAAVQGDTLLVLHFGVILFLQVLYSLTILFEFNCKHIVAYFLSLCYGLTVVHPAYFLQPAGALACLSYATMTTHYVYCYNYDDLTQEQPSDDQTTPNRNNVDVL